MERGVRGVKSLAKRQSQTVLQAHSHVHKMKHFDKIDPRISFVSTPPQSAAQWRRIGTLARSTTWRRALVSFMHTGTPPNTPQSRRTLQELIFTIFAWRTQA